MAGRFSFWRYIFKAVWPPFVFGLTAFSLIMVAGGVLFKLAQLILEQGLPVSLACRLFMYQIPSVVVLTLPMACLLGGLLGFGSLASHSEVIALKASGVPFRKIIVPVLIYSAIVAVFVFYIGELIVPRAVSNAQNLMARQVAQKSGALIKEGVFLKIPVDHGVDVVHLNKFDSVQGRMEGVLVQQFDEQGRLTLITTAPQGVWDQHQWVLKNGRSYLVDPQGKVQNLLTFDRQVLTLSLTPDQIGKTSVKAEDLSSRDLRQQIEVARLKGEPVAAMWVDYYLKFALPFSCVILSIVGVTLGARSNRRSGVSVGFGQSVLIVFVYYLLMSLGRGMGAASMVSPVLGAWIPNLLFAVVGIGLVWRAD